MANPRDRPHIILRTAPRAQAYRPWPRPAKEPLPPLPATLRAHADHPRDGVEEAVSVAGARRREAEAAGLERSTDGITLEFESPPGFELELKSLESDRRGIELLSARTEDVIGHEHQSQRAIVFVPDSQVGYFLKRFDEYASEDKKTKKGNPANQKLVQRIAAVRLATLRELWTDDPGVYPAEGEAIW